MKQHAVPENIMDVEFKLFGSLTAKQFGYIVVGGGVGVFLYFFFKSLNSTLLGWIFAILSAILGLALALIRINDQPFEVWLGNFLSAMFSSQKRVWKKGKKDVQPLKEEVPVVTPTQVIQQPPVTQTVPEPSVKQQDAQIPEHPFKDLREGQGPQVAPLEIQTTPQPQDTQLAGDSISQNTSYLPGSAQKYMTMSTNQVPNRPLGAQPGTGTNASPAPASSMSQPSSTGVANTQSDDADIIAKDQGENTQTAFPAQPGVTPQQVVQEGQPQTASVPKVTEDVQEAAKARVYTNKALQYTDVMPDKSQAIGTSQSVQTVPISSQQDDLSDENKALRQKVADFSQEKVRLEQELSQTKTESAKALEELKTLRQEAISLKSQGGAPVPQVTGQLGQVQADTNVLTPKVYNGPSLSKKPNIVSGIVRTQDGKLLPGVIVIAKNESGRPVRAMKTNSLGQFVSTTALDDGIYVIELSKGGFTFGRYEVKLTGDVMPTYEITAA